MSKPLLLDLCCKAGGASKGYADAGFEVVGVDIEPQPRYPFEFHQADALMFLAEFGWQFDAISASPPCQAYSKATRQSRLDKHRKLIGPLRDALRTLGKPYVIENVENARSEMVCPVRICGSSFGMRIQRHRMFEANWPIQGTDCQHEWQNDSKIYTAVNKLARGGPYASGIVPVFGANRLIFDGHSNNRKELAVCREVMGIPWMTKAELNQAIPPRYTEYIGEQLMRRGVRQ